MALAKMWRRESRLVEGRPGLLRAVQFRKGIADLFTSETA